MGPLPNGLSMVILTTWTSPGIILQPQVIYHSIPRPLPKIFSKIPKNQIHQELATSPFAGCFSMRLKNGPNWENQPTSPNIWFHTLAFDGICSVCDLPLVGNFCRNRACRWWWFPQPWKIRERAFWYTQSHGD